MKFAVLLILLSTVIGCVEVRDKDEEPVVIEVQSYGQNLIVDQPMYVHAGGLLTASEYQRSVKSNPAPWVKQSYVFNYKQVTIKPSGVIFTMGHDVNMRIDDLYSEEGLIATFPEETRAMNSDGRSGGMVNFDIHSAQGFLNIEMRGEHGAHAKPAREPGSELDSKPHLKGTLVNAKKGYPGNKGFAGGNTGSLYFKAREATSFNVDVKSLIGLGGDKGLGGLGGWDKKRGVRVGSGPDGQPGASGIEEKILVNLGSK